MNKIGNEPKIPSANLIKSLEELELHDHPCLIYQNDAERLAVVAPFMRLGWEQGERCLYFAHEAGVRKLLEDLPSVGIDVSDALSNQSLIVPNVHVIYKKDEAFDPEKVFRFIRQTARDAKEEGYRGLRLIGEMPWTLEGLSGAGPGRLWSMRQGLTT